MSRQRYAFNEVNDWVHSSKRIVPGDEADYWVDKILNNSTSGLIQSLAAMNQIIQVFKLFLVK